VDVLSNNAHGAVVIQNLGPNVAATLNQTDNKWVVSLATEASRALCLTGPRQLGFVSFHGLAETAKLFGATRSHGVTNAVAKVPSGFHAAAKEPL
jgi:hypothetical protein